MPDTVNPYTPGQPIADPKLFLGRQDILTSIRRQLVQGRRVFVVSGARRVGKTSLLRQLPTHLPEEFVLVRVELSEENAQRLDRLLWRLANAIGHQAGSQLGGEDLAPAWADFEGHADRLLDQFWPQVRAALGDQCLVLMLDDLDSLLYNEINLLAPLVAVLSAWLNRKDPQNRVPGTTGKPETPPCAVAVVLTVSLAQQEAMMRAYPRLFGEALTYVLGPLTSKEATRLITRPVDGVITYDYDAVRRLIEVTSGHPYYLQWLCSEMFNRCARAGRVNWRDVDLLVADLVGRDIADFGQVWDESSPQEQVVLAGLISLRGTRGAATVLDVRIILAKVGVRVERDQISEALESLVARGILERLGAVSYRFGVTLLHDWLRERIDLQEVVRDTPWTTKGRGGFLGRWRTRSTSR
jgi:hypothetical protein